LGVSADANRNVFVTGPGDNTVIEIPFDSTNQTYGTPISVGPSLSGNDVAVDAGGNLFVANGGVTEVPYNSGNNTYGTAIPLASSAIGAISITVDAAGHLYALGSGAVWKITP